MIVLLAFASFFCVTQVTGFRDTESHFYFVAELEDVTPKQVSDAFGLIDLGQIGPLVGHFAFGLKHDGSFNQEHVMNNISNHQQDESSAFYPVARGIKRFDGQGISRITRRFKMPKFNLRIFERERNQVRDKLDIKDPGFSYQWYLFNTADKGNDLNVVPVWMQGITGSGVTVAIIDDGLDFSSLDFLYNFRITGSYDFNGDSGDPSPKLKEDGHGTRCAGEIAALKNGKCGVGVAYGASVSSIRAVAQPLINSDEAIVISYKSQINDIYSCSWGPDDDGKTMEAPSPTVVKAMEHSLREGRQGKGSIYVFASGNGGAWGDNCNFDGYANSLYTIAVGAIDYLNRHPNYSEGCSALLVSTYSGDDDDQKRIYTTDVNGKCTDEHSGTSAAAPLVSGVLALVLQVRPDLTWRDIQYLLVESAIPVDTSHPSWDTTFQGRKFSNLFGYGKVDASNTVAAAMSFKSKRPQSHLTVGPIKVGRKIPESISGLSESVIISKEMLTGASFGSLEHVTVWIKIDHEERRDVELSLISPNNVTSLLIESRSNDVSTDGFPGWTVMSVKHWGEPVAGEWRIKVTDIFHNNGKTGSLKSWKITFYGESVQSPLKKVVDTGSSILQSILSIFS